MSVAAPAPSRESRSVKNGTLSWGCEANATPGKGLTLGMDASLDLVKATRAAQELGSHLKTAMDGLEMLE